MSFNTYTTLVAGIEAFLEDDGAELEASIPDIINLAEIRVVRDLDLEIFRALNSTIAMVVGTALITKAVIATRVVSKEYFLTSAGVYVGELLLRSPAFVREYTSGATNGVPKYYCEYSETQIQVGPPPGATYTINERYLARPTALASGNQTNWLTDHVADLLFKAALAEAEPFLKAEDRQVWITDYAQRLVAARRELYEFMGTRYEMIGAQPTVNAVRSETP